MNSDLAGFKHVSNVKRAASYAVVTFNISHFFYLEKWSKAQMSSLWGAAGVTWFVQLGEKAEGWPHFSLHLRPGRQQNGRC